MKRFFNNILGKIKAIFAIGSNNQVIGGDVNNYGTEKPPETPQEEWHYIDIAESSNIAGVECRPHNSNKYNVKITFNGGNKYEYVDIPLYSWEGFQREQRNSPGKAAQKWIYPYKYYKR